MRALITGVTGQDGYYLSRHLLDSGYEVIGVKRRHSSLGASCRTDPLFDNPKFRMVYGDMLDPIALCRILVETEPDEIYNLAAQSHVGVSFELPQYTVSVAGNGVVNLLEAARLTGCMARIYQASTSEMFGNAAAPQSESTEFRPASPYAAAKCMAHHMCGVYREAYGMHVSCGILFNHESPIRGETFVTAKVVRAAARIAAHKQSFVALGNLDARRDWGHARDYVRAMHMMLQQDRPDDYVIASGISYSVADLCRIAFGLFGLDYKNHVTQGPRRPLDVNHLEGDASKARRILGWEPEVSFCDLIREMAESETAKAREVK